MRKKRKSEKGVRKKRKSEKGVRKKRNNEKGRINESSKWSKKKEEKV